MPTVLKEQVDLCDKLESYGFRCLGGPLALCTDWQDFKRFTLSHFYKDDHNGTDTCAVCGHNLRHSVHQLITLAAQEEKKNL